MLNASKFVAASVILALVGGLLVMTLPTEPTVEPIPAVETATASVTPTPEATVAETVPATMESNGPTISLPDELPEGTQSGTIETPAGSIRWARVPVTEDTPGYVGSVGPWGDGLVIWGYISPNFSTKDGVIWERLKPPGQVRGLVGDKHVAIDLIQGRPWDPPKDRVWLGSAGSGWQELDASAMAGVPIEGWEQRGRRIESGPMVVDGRTVFMIASQYRLPYAKLGIPTNQRNKTRSMKPLGGGRYALCGSGTGPRSCRQAGADARWILRFEETPGGLRVTNDRTDERLGILEGASADDLYEGGGGARHSYYAIEGDVVVEIESPWPGTSLKQLGRHTVAPGGSEPIRTHWLANGRVPVTAPGVPSIAA